MEFYGSTFTFDGIPCEKFGLSLWTPSGGESSVPGGDIELITESIYRRPTEYLLGVKQTPVLEFEINFVSENEIDYETSSLISRWLFGHKQYKKLVIIQPDLQSVYYNAMFLHPKKFYIGNILRGFNATVHCDSPWGWTAPKTYTWHLNYPLTNNMQISFLNFSDNNDYVYPTIEFKNNKFTSHDSFTLRNDSDQGREFKFYDLSVEEIITVNCDLQTVASSKNVFRIGNSNKKFFRLVPGRNTLFLTGNLDYLKITVSYARK